MAVVKLVIGAECDNMSKRFNVVASELGMYTIYDNMGKKSLSDFEAVKLLNKYGEEINLLKNDFVFKDTFINDLKEENEQLKQFPVKLDNRIQKLEESLKALKEMETDDLNTQAVEDVATVIGISLNALMEFRKELKGDVE